VATLLDAVKLQLRISSAAYDDEITMLIAAARSDLILSGVSAAAVNATEPDALVKRAIVTYCRGSFGLDNPDSEKYMASFHSLETHLALSSEYKAPILTGITGTIAAGSDELTVDDATNIAADDWLTVAGAAPNAALLIVQVVSVAGSVVTIDGIAGTTVSDAVVTLA
jgi:uncharacterized phage protein (predicted DNA packaging)